MIAAVVVTHSAPAELLDRCLGALRSAGGVDHIVVVDTGARVEIAGRRTDVEVVAIENRGYGAAANVGFETARKRGADMVALLNDDVIVHTGWLEPLTRELAVAAVGAAQPMLVTSGDGAPRVSSLGVRIDCAGAGVDMSSGDEPDYLAAAHDIDLFTGGAVLFSVDFLNVAGGFDERYFLYYEDVDLARRGGELGWRYRVVPTSVVEHVGGFTTGRNPEHTRYFQERNRLWAAFRFADVATICRAVWLSVRRLRHSPRSVHARALLAGLAGAPRRVFERSRRVTRVA